MGNAHKKSSPKRDGETPRHKEGAYNGPKKEPLSNGRPAPQDRKGDSEKASRAPDPNQNTEPSLQPMSPAARLKAEGNQLFKNGQFGEATSKYTEAITELRGAGSENAEELGVLYSNRAACQLKEGNCKECIEDCNRALELQPYSMKPLLRRAMANESLERYRDAYVDYKIALQIDQGMQVANDSINRITRTLIDQDGTNWREKLPPIPSVAVSFLLQRHEGNIASSDSVQPASPAGNDRPGSHAGESAEERFWSLKIEGNEHVTSARYSEAAEKYTECLKINSEDCTIYTNRALCYLKLCRYEEARHDCECALQMDDSNIKALYRRAQANKGLENYQQSAVDIKKTLALYPTNKSALALMEEITPYLTSTSQGKLRKKIEIEEVSEHEEPSQPVPTCPNGGPQNNKLSETSAATKPQMPKPTNAYEFDQRINEAKASRDTEACARLLSTISPEDLPVFLTNKLEGDILLMIIRSLKHGVLLQNPTLVYQHLSYLTKAERFQVALMFLDNEKAEIQSLFTSLSENPPERVSSEDILSLAREYGL